MFVRGSSQTRLRSLSIGLGVACLVSGCAPHATAATTTTSSNGASTGATVQVSASKTGKRLTTSSGMTLYRYNKDSKNTSVCKGRCARIWPPLMWKGSGKPTKGPSVPGTLGVIDRPTGKQVTYNGVPLYTYSHDTSPGDTNGQGFKTLWYVATPSMTTKSLANSASRAG